MNLNNYQKVKKIGINRTVEINWVYNKINKKYFVMKTIKISDFEKEIKEVKILKKLKSKYIIELKDYLILNGKIHLLMNYYPKGDLYKLLKRERNLDLNTILKLFYKVLKAIKFLHLNNIIHRDIKPENVLLDENMNPILIDFGFSSDSNENWRKTFCGTFEYMAPEVFLGNHQDKYTDIWSLGILLYELLYKRSPFYGKNYSEIKNNILNKEPLIDNIKFNYKINDLILKMLRKNPKNRMTINEIIKNEIFYQFKKIKRQNYKSENCRAVKVKKNIKTTKSPTNNFWNVKNNIFKKNLQIKKLIKMGSYKTKETNITSKNEINLKDKYSNKKNKTKKSILNPSKDKSHYKNVSLYSKLNWKEKIKNNLISNKIILMNKIKLNKLESKKYKCNSILQFKFKN